MHPLIGTSFPFTRGWDVCADEIGSTKLSKALITDASKIEWKSPADLKIKFGTTIRIGVVSISSRCISSTHLLLRP
jgi:hypothetical protein